MLLIASRLAADQSVLPETVLITGGTFTLGTPIEDKRDKAYHADEAPREVYVKTFRIGKYPVTAMQFCTFLNSSDALRHNSSLLHFSGKSGPDENLLEKDGRFRPVAGREGVPMNAATWKGAVLFCRWLSKETGKTYRLPSEAEWELAARGIEGRPWPWGSDNPTQEHGGRYASYGTRRGNLNRPVGSFPANATPDGVYDMMAYINGEWCAGKGAKNAAEADAVSTNLSNDELTLRRPIRGMWTRPNSRPDTPKWLQPILWESPTGTHLGRTWTRSTARPVNVIGYCFGFRVVEVLDSEQSPFPDAPAPPADRQQ
ncbi:MAG: formylglycine-generating enzyme family protein [Candidatus Pacebacteria bacterium]|nr:formylglycine-generating enzyme family protein [Candidatus Paceibacterota bacterium]